MQNFEQIRSHLDQGRLQASPCTEPYVVCVELSLDKATRHQAIFLSELGDDDGRNYLRVSTAIAPITGLDARRALAFNWESRVGYLAIGDLDGVPYLQLCENRPYDGLTPSEVDRLVLEIGGTGRPHGTRAVGRRRPALAIVRDAARPASRVRGSGSRPAHASNSRNRP